MSASRSRSSRASRAPTSRACASSPAPTTCATCSSCATWLSALKLGETALAVSTQDPERAQRAARAFAEHDHVVQAKLYAVHKSAPDAHITVSNELRDQLKRTLREDDSEVRGKLAP